MKDTRNGKAELETQLLAAVVMVALVFVFVFVAFLMARLLIRII